jgi:hypothetical protein
MNIGPIFADPLARQLYAEIASVESQHITHYGSMLNPEESLIEKLLLGEACEVWNYAGCLAQESNPRVKAIWEKFLDYELGHFQAALTLFKDVERRDPETVLGDGKLPSFIQYQSHRDFVRKTIEREVSLRKNGTEFVPKEQEGKSSLAYREAVNADGSPSSTVSDTYSWMPGTELMRQGAKAA